MQLKGLLLLALLSGGNLQAQEDHRQDVIVNSTFDKGRQDMYHVKNATVIPLTVVLGGAAIYAMTIIYSKKATPESVILNLNKQDVPAFDRWSAGWHDDNLDKISYYPFYAVMPLPLVLLADKGARSEKGRIGLMYLEAFAFEGVLYTGSVYFADRFRPDVYNTDLPMSYRTNGNFRNSFFAGHVAVVALSTLFTSKVYDDYHPDSHFKWVLYGASAAATLGMAYLRLEAGKHFTSDIVTGMAVGTACGLLVPALHKNKDMSTRRTSFYPALLNNGAGLTMIYKM